jgi:hypothetical protein
MESQLHQSSTPKKVETDTSEVPDEQPLAPPFAPPLTTTKSQAYRIVDPTEQSTAKVSWMGRTYNIPPSYIIAFQKAVADSPETFIDLRNVILSEMMRNHQLPTLTSDAKKE